MGVTRQKITTGLALTVIPMIFGAGAGLSAAQSKVDSLVDRVKQTGEKVDRIDQRVAEIYCSQIPVAKRPGCR